jgi:hypothetical protein
MFLCVYSEFVCRQRPCDGLISRPWSPTDCLRIKKLKRKELFTDALRSKEGEEEREGEEREEEEREEEEGKKKKKSF